MERVLQYMDDVDDLYGAFGLFYESLRRFFVRLIAAAAGIGLVALGIWLALVHPPSALATCLLSSVTLLYRAVTAPGFERR